MVEVWNELMAEILSITKSEGKEAGKKCFIVLVQVVVVIDELGKEGLTVNMQFAKLQGKLRHIPSSC